MLSLPRRRRACHALSCVGLRGTVQASKQWPDVVDENADLPAQSLELTGPRSWRVRAVPRPAAQLLQPAHRFRGLGGDVAQLRPAVKPAVARSVPVTINGCRLAFAAGRR